MSVKNIRKRKYEVIVKINGDDVRYVPEKDMTSFSAVAHRSRYLFVKNNFDLTNSAILDFGCGSGYGSYSLSENALSVDGIDYSKQAVDYAKNLIQK